MPELDDATLEYLLARAGLAPTDAQKAGRVKSKSSLSLRFESLTMAESVRKPRGRMAEPVLIYGFAEEDLA